jgi:hypothetical protein
VPFPSFQRKPESSVFKDLRNLWTPFFNGVTTFYERINVQNGNAAEARFWSFEFGTLDIVSGFVLRISDFQLPRKSQRNLDLRF